MMYTLDHNGWDFRIDDHWLSISVGGKAGGRFNLAPLLDEKPMSLGPWKPITPNHFAAQLSDQRGAAHLAVEHGHVCYWVETAQKAFDRVTYFPPSEPTGSAWQSY